jgi:hypothetical protein
VAASLGATRTARKRCIQTRLDAKSSSFRSFGKSKGGVIGPKRAPSPDGKNMDSEDWHQVREGVRQGDARAAEYEGQRRRRSRSIPSPLEWTNGAPSRVISRGRVVKYTDRRVHTKNSATATTSSRTVVTSLDAAWRSCAVLIGLDTQIPRH